MLAHEDFCLPNMTHSTQDGSKNTHRGQSSQMLIAKARLTSCQGRTQHSIRFAQLPLTQLQQPKRLVRSKGDFVIITQDLSCLRSRSQERL